MWPAWRRSRRRRSRRALRDSCRQHVAFEPLGAWLVIDLVVALECACGRSQVAFDVVAEVVQASLVALAPALDVEAACKRERPVGGVGAPLQLDLLGAVLPSSSSTMTPLAGARPDLGSAPKRTRKNVLPMGFEVSSCKRSSSLLSGLGRPSSALS